MDTKTKIIQRLVRGGLSYTDAEAKVAMYMDYVDRVYPQATTTAKASVMMSLNSTQIKQEVRKMRVAIQYGSYNQRRYSRPWIARITAWPVGGKPDVEWGRYVGDDGGGEVEIEAQPGDIVRSGQRDGRGGNTSADWYIVRADGSLDPTDAPQARKAWDARQADKAVEHPPADLSGITDADLIAEIKRRRLTA